MAAHIHRMFLDWNEPALPSAVAVLAGHYTAGDVLDMAHCTAVLPGARAGRRLKELLVELAASRGLRLVPPAVTTVGLLPERLFEPPLPLAEPAACRRAWVHALRAAEPAALELLFSRPPAAADVRGWTALAREVERLHRMVGGAGLSFADVVEECAAHALFDDGERWRVLAGIQARYADTLARLGRADRELARNAAIADAGTAEIWLIGVAEMPRVVRRMLERLPGTAPVRALVHAPEARADAFDALGCVRVEAWLDAEVPIADTQLSLCDRPADQAAAAVHAIAALDARYAADEIVIGVPDEEVVPYLVQRLAAAQLPVRYAAGTPVERTAPYRLLAAFGDYLADGSAAAFAALVRHPDLGRRLRRAGAGRHADSWLAPLDQYLSEHLPARVDRRLPGESLRVDGADRHERRAARRRLDTRRLQQALASSALLGDMRRQRRLAEWASSVLELLVHVYGESPVQRDVLRERRLLEACTQLRNAAAGLYRLPAELDEVCDGATAIRLVLDEARGAIVPPDPERAAIELLGALELHLDDAPVAIITGVNEPFLPASLNADAFLPNQLRTRLGLEDNDRRYARDAYQLTALLHARAVVRIIAGRRSGTGDPLLPSRLLLARRGEALARRVAGCFGTPAAQLPAAPPLAAGDAAAGDGAAPVSRFALPPEPVLHAPAPVTQLAVTALGRLLTEPYVFALEHVLRLRRIDDSARELDPLRFGSLGHGVLEAFGRSAAVHATAVERIEQELDVQLDRAVSTRFGDRAGAALPAVRVQIEQLRARLRAFAAWHARWIADGWRVVGTECGTPDDGVPFDVDGVPIRLTGRIDRIDYHAGRDAWALLDYKTGEAGDPPDRTHRRGAGARREWVDLQLPLYRHILPFVGDAAGRPVFDGAPDAAVLLGYIALCADGDDVGVQIAEWSAADLADADAAARDAVRMLRRNRFEFERERAARFPAEFAALIGRHRLVAANSDDADDDADDDAAE